MRRSESTDMDASTLAEILCSSSNINKVVSALGELEQDEVYDLCTTILSNGHTVLHMLAQRQKLQPLRLVLQRGVDVNARNAQGATPLHMALQHNALFAAKVLIDHGAQVSEVTSRRKGTTLLHRMVSCDRPHAVLLLLEERADVNARDSEGRTPLHLAAIYGNSVVAAILVRHQQCDVNAVDKQGYTALMLAIINNNQELARQLVDAPRVDVTLRDKNSMSSLHLAVSLGQLEVVRTLLRRNTANINSKERHMGRTPIHLACALICSSDGVVSSTCVAVDVSALPTSPDSDEMNGNVDSVSNQAVMDDDDVPCPQDVSSTPNSFCSFLEPNHSTLPSATEMPSPSPADDDGKRLEHIVDEQPPAKTSLVNSFSPGPSSMIVNGTQGEDGRPRASIMKAPRTSMVVDSTSKHSVTIHNESESQTAAGKCLRPRVSIAEHHSESKRQARHSIAGDSLVRSPRHHSPLRQSLITSPRKIKRPATAPISSSQRQLVTMSPQSRLKAMCQDNGRDSPASTQSRGSVVMIVNPYNIAAVRCKIVSLLLEHGADANLMTAFRKSPLHITAIMGASDVIAVLLPNVTNVNVLSVSNKTALHLAVERGHVAVTAQLLNAGANVMLRDISGHTALHIAAILGNAQLVRLLLKFKAHKNSSDFQQMSPLHHACLHHHEDVIAILLKAGARRDTLDSAGFRPEDYRKVGSTPASAVTSSSLEDSNSTTDSIDKVAASQECSQRLRKPGLLLNINDAVPRAAEDFQRPRMMFGNCNR